MSIDRLRQLDRGKGCWKPNGGKQMYRIHFRAGETQARRFRSALKIKGTDT